MEIPILDSDDPVRRGKRVFNLSISTGEVYPYRVIASTICDAVTAAIQDLFQRKALSNRFDGFDPSLIEITSYDSQWEAFDEDFSHLAKFAIVVYI